MRPFETIAIHEIPELLRGWLGPSTEVVSQIREGDDNRALVVRHDEVTFVVEVKGSDAIAAIDSARRQLAGYLNARPDAVAVLAVPHMGRKARAFARSQGLSWLDLSGNADIRGPGVRVLVQGRSNRFASPGRPSSAFTDKAARISRSMLVEPRRWWRQAELVEVTGLSSGYVSKVVRRLDEDDLLDQRHEGSFRPRSPDLLLDAWAQVYDFRKHDIARYHAVGRTGVAVAERVARRLAAQPGLRWAATGLAGAWQHDAHADFRLATFLVSAPVLDPERLGLRPVERGENVWVVVPKDEGVLYGSQEVSGLLTAHPVQVYLDLLGHPERADEAAAHLREHEIKEVAGVEGREEPPLQGEEVRRERADDLLRDAEGYDRQHGLDVGRRRRQGARTTRLIDVADPHRAAPETTTATRGWP